MANVPTPKSYEQILGDMLATYMSKIGVNDLNVGSAVTGFFETMAQAVYRASGDTFSILRDFSVDRAEGEALERLREEENLPAIIARVATGVVTIGDSSFTKISTKVYAGTAPPNVGSTSINVSDASAFPATGSIYIGRGTANVEGPLPYSSISVVGSYYQINLTSPTTKYHNTSETVILSQGGTRDIPVGQVVKTVGTGSSPNINFTTTIASLILDGETEITNVPVSAQEPGSSGNVPRNAIQSFESLPFSGATVTNPSPFTTGRDQETEEQTRNRIKKARVSKGLGTALAIKNAVLDAQATDEKAVVTSNEIFSDGEETTLFIDDGRGYEQKTEGVGLEFIVDSALGGEQFFQLSTGGSQTSVSKAFLESRNVAPFEINPNDRLSILVGDILSEHVFAEGDFRTNGAATAFEVVASINANSNISFSARTIENGTKVTIDAKSETEEFLQVTDPTSGTDASIALDLPTSEIQTLRLYKNDQPLSRNGRSAIIESANQIDWSNTIVGGDTLIVAVDGTAEITYTFTDNDFLSEGTHATVSKNNTLQSWVNVINSKITGLTASINGNRLVLTSNLGSSSRAALSISSSSTLVTKGMFTVANGLTASGREADFTLSRNTAQLKLTSPLAAGDSLTAGSDFTQGSVSSSAILGGNVTLSGDAELWFLIDNPDASIISHGVLADSEVHFTKEAGNVLRFRSVLTNAFGNVQPGDYVILWSSDLLPGNRIEGRVSAVGTSLVTNDYFEVRVTSVEYAAASGEGPVTFLEGLSFVRTDVTPQKVVISAGVYDINTVAANLTSQITGATAIVENDEILTISTDNKDTDGTVLLVTYNDPANNLNFTEGASDSSVFSHFGFSRSDSGARSFPLFIHGTVTSERQANPPVSYIANFETAVDLAALGVDPNVIACMQDPYLSAGSFVRDHQSSDECIQVDDIVSTTVDISDSKTIRRIRISDRYYLLSPLDFDFDDDLTIVLDSDAANKTFPINLFRNALSNTTQGINSNEFRAYDADAGSTIEFSQFFTSSYDFKNYKALMKARNVIDPNSAVDEDAILYRAAIWGKSGNLYDIGYVYPTAPNLDVQSSLTITDKVRIRISLKSGDAVADTIDGTTEWDVTVTPNTPVAGVEEVTYTHNGTGSAPGLGSVLPGHYVTINSQGEFDPANIGTFRISSATATSFTVRRPSGSAVAETGVASLTVDVISIYENSDTTAQEIVDHVTSDLTDWITAELVDDNGDTGAGVISLSTYEDNNFVANTESVSLVDGINWIASSDLGATAPDPQFTFKRTLDLPSFDTNTVAAYAFNNGEEIRLIPTTTQQLEEYLKILAVTGVTTLGEVESAVRQQDLQLSTSILGSEGSVTVSGGSGDTALAQVVGNSTDIIGTNLMKTVISRSSAGGFNGGSYVKIASTNLQKKLTGISFTTNATITPNSPGATESTVELGNRDIADLYFGEPRNHFRDRGRAFHVEKHGSLVNIAWDGATGSDPVFSKTVNFNDSVGNMSVNFNADFLTTEYIVTSGDRNFREVSPGDLVVVQNFSDDDNNGTFVVAGVSDDGLTLSLENPDGVSAGSAAVGLGDIVITTDVREGDLVEIGDPFDILNQGQFRVIRRYLNSIYIDNPSAVEERVVVADNLRTIPAVTSSSFDVTVSGAMRITVAAGAADFSNVKMGDVLTVGTAFALANQGTFMVTKATSTYVEVANADAAAESGVVVSGVGGDVLEAQEPAMLFSAYENTRAGDTFTISGTVLGENNSGIYNISEVLDKNTIVLDEILEAQALTQLNNLFSQVFVEEGTAYVGYKRVLLRAVDPESSTRTVLVFDSDNEFLKINQASGAIITALGKLSFPSGTATGFDSYRYDTGLIAESNKIVYGDPRDNVTYPGVSAAGAEIFIKPPLVRRIEVSINVRVQTGVPFSRVTEQVRNNIAALINSSPIGESIAISDIVSTVNVIPGVTAVSISSPTYDPSNDVIVIQPSEKPFILDIVNDISVSKIE